MRDHYSSVLTELGDDPKEDQEVHNPVNKGNVVPQEGIWTSWVELSNGGDVSPSEVLPSSNPSGRVIGNAIGYPPRLSSAALSVYSGQEILKYFPVHTSNSTCTNGAENCDH